MVFSPRALAACLSLAALLVAACSWSGPRRAEWTSKHRSRCLKPAAAGIHLRDGAQGIVLLNRHAHKVNDLATGRAMRQSYVDSETGYVTINNVYVE